MRIYLSQLKDDQRRIIIQKKIIECEKDIQKPGTNCRQKILNMKLTYLGRS